jgi:phage shock protein PspC (stress-responsive transcriptional regulator)
LQRDRDERLLAGVCSGIGEYLGVDPNVVRIAFALTALLPPLTAISVLGYVALAVLLPEEGTEQLSGRERVRHNLEGLRSDVEGLAGSLRRGLDGTSRSARPVDRPVVTDTRSDPAAPAESEIDRAAAAGTRRSDGQP